MKYKQWKKNWKNRYFITKDDFSNKIYAGDVVELYMPFETKTTWQSEVYYNPLDGAFVDAHPAHVQMGLSKYRKLSNFLNQEINNLNDTKGYCKKIKNFYNN
jgi:hypothetical protein